MFTEIRATNFKPWARLAPYGSADRGFQIDRPGLPLGQVTGFFGANSSGKTSILQVLLLLKQTAESADRRSPLDLGDARSPIQLGTYGDVLRDHDQKSELGLGMGWRVSDRLTVQDPECPDQTLFTADNFSFSTEINSRRGVMEVGSFTYIAGSDTAVYLGRISSVGSRYELIATVNGDSNYLKPFPRASSDMLAPVKCYGFPDRVSTYFQNAGFVSDLELSFEEQLRRTYYLGPVREVPLSTYAWTGASPADVGYRGAGAIPVLLAAQLSGRRENFRRRTRDGRRLRLISVEQHVAEWLKELGLVHSFRVAPIQEGANIYRVYVRRSESSPEVLLTDVGFGVSQVLPVLVLLAYVPEGSTVILEQPEIHLHPAVQSGLADVILEAALVRNVQVIVESHSEHLLTRIQLRVAEQHLTNGTVVSADDVRLWFIDQPDGVSQAKDLKLNEYGEIVNWPKDFFGDPFTETARIAKAGLRRRRNTAQSLPTTQPGESRRCRPVDSP
jgi:predicted ATPase